MVWQDPAYVVWQDQAYVVLALVLTGGSRVCFSGFVWFTPTIRVHYGATGAPGDVRR